MPDAPPTYRERLGVPLRWWVQGTMLVASLWLALVVATPGVVAWSATAVALGLLAALLISYGRGVIEVDATTLRAGRASIEGVHLGSVQPLDADATRLVAGRDADVRAFLLMRPYRSRSVRVEILDPRDPTPYWLLSTRRPEELAAALERLAGTTPRGGPAGPDGG